jgi:hypothetical protein
VDRLDRAGQGGLIGSEFDQTVHLRFVGLEMGKGTWLRGVDQLAQELLGFPGQSCRDLWFIGENVHQLLSGR